MAFTRPARLAVLAAALAGLVTFAAFVWSGRGVRQPVAHRVELEVPPVDAALWFATRYPGYFRSGEAGLRAWLDGLHERDREFVLAMATTLTWTWVEHELANFEDHELDPLAREAITVVRHKTLNQLEFNLDRFGKDRGMELDAHVGEPLFTAGVFARLVRGASNCEGQNHLLALLLDTALEPELDAEMVSVRIGHELVQVHGAGLAQPVFVDAWANLPPFSLDPSQPSPVAALDELGDAPPSVVPGHVVRSPATADVYAEAAITSLHLLPERDAPTRGVDLEVRAPKLDAASLQRIKDPWRVYLYARILQIYDDPRAAEVYRVLIDRFCMDHPRPQNFVCAAAPQLRKRLPGFR